MKTALKIAAIDLKRMVRDRTFFFWTLVFPLVFIIIFGNLYSGDKGQPKASLTVINKDSGAWGDYLLKKIAGPEMSISQVTALPKKFNRCLEIPKDFSKKLQKLKPQTLTLKINPSASSEAAAQAESRIIQGLTRMIAEIVIHPRIATFFSQSRRTFSELVTLDSTFPPDTMTVNPDSFGFDHVIPGMIVNFIMLLGLIYGGVFVMTDRDSGTLARILFADIGIPRLWTGKFIGRSLIGLTQSAILVVVGILFFALNLGNIFLSALNIVFFSAAISALSILLGSVLRREQVIVGMGILLSNLFAALGGCWWPLEIVSEPVKAAGMIFPSYWAMDAFHKIIFFNGSLEDILLNLLILAAFTLLFSLLSFRFFKIRN